MSSHGVPRYAGAKPSSDQARRKELQKIEEYKLLVDQVDQGIERSKFDVDLLQQISRLLQINPEYYTMWNHRRLIMRHLFSQSIARDRDVSPGEEKSRNGQSIGDLISHDLDFLLPLLRKFPKCYWIWNYRLWALGEATRLLPASDARAYWQRDLALASKMLSLDSRNFHGWGYRRVVVEALESQRLSSEMKWSSQIEEEFAYTTKMIGSNLSNFSAWHNRSKIIVRLLDERKADDAARLRFLDGELELIQRALADPSDQSLWFYHQYLMCTFDPSYATESMAPNLTTGQRLAYVLREIENLTDMLEFDEDCKWIYKSLIELSILHRTLSQEWPISKDQLGVWLLRIKNLDPLRKGRWDDLEQSLAMS
ncbi:MAG: hypothetical protein Q9191_004605 [Dirinaria sp. TL-2023a]